MDILKIKIRKLYLSDMMSLEYIKVFYIVQNQFDDDSAVVYITMDNLVDGAKALLDLDDHCKYYLYKSEDEFYVDENANLRAAYNTHKRNNALNELIG